MVELYIQLKTLHIVSTVIYTFNFLSVSFELLQGEHDLAIVVLTGALLDWEVRHGMDSSLFINASWSSEMPHSGKCPTPAWGPLACGIVANDILRTARVLSNAKLNNKINLVQTWPPVYLHSTLH